MSNEEQMIPESIDPDAWINEIQCIGPEYKKRLYGKFPIQSLQAGYYKHYKLYEEKNVIGLMKSAYYDGYTDREAEQRKTEDSKQQEIDKLAGELAIVKGREEFDCQRLRNVARFLGLESALPETDHVLHGSVGTVCGMFYRKIGELNKVIGSYKTLVSSMESQLAFYRKEQTKESEAVGTLDSEREANAKLTSENDALRQQLVEQAAQVEKMKKHTRCADDCVCIEYPTKCTCGRSQALLLEPSAALAAHDNEVAAKALEYEATQLDDWHHSVAGYLRDRATERRNGK